MNKVRAAKYAEAREWGYPLASYVSSQAAWLTDDAVGDNCFVLEHSAVQPFARLGNDVVVWSGARICHDAVVDDHCFIAANAVVLGCTHIGARSFVGANATVRNHVSLGAETLVGAGATVTRDTLPQEVYVPERSVKLSKTSDQIQL